MSRGFVCVRLDPWLNEKNVERIVSLTSHHENTALCLIPPGADGLSADSFPTTASCFWGPVDFEPLASPDAWQTMLKKVGRMLPAMQKLAKDHPGKSGIEADLPTLPVLPHLVEALNVGFCDNRAVIAMVAPAADAERLEANLCPLLFEEQIAGRAHIVRMTREEWATAIADELVDVGDSSGEAGVFVIGPESFGRTGTLLAQTPGNSTQPQIRAMLMHGLDAFNVAFKKLDRSSHILEGKRAGVAWKKHHPQAWEKYVTEPPACEDPLPVSPE